MVDPLPPYPPPHDAWSYPPPPVSRHWLWVAIGGSVVATIALVAFITTIMLTGSSDLPDSIENSELLDEITRECGTLQAVRSIDVDAPVAERIARVEEQTQILRDVLTSWRSISSELRASDEPFDEWLEDWQRIIDAREDYVAELETDPNATFDVPRVDGEPIVGRMNALDTGCPVPSTLLRPDQGISART